MKFWSLKSNLKRQRPLFFFFCSTASYFFFFSLSVNGNALTAPQQRLGPARPSPAWASISHCASPAKPNEACSHLAERRFHYETLLNKPREKKTKKKWNAFVIQHWDWAEGDFLPHLLPLLTKHTITHNSQSKIIVPKLFPARVNHCREETSPASASCYCHDGAAQRLSDCKRQIVRTGLKKNPMKNQEDGGGERGASAREPCWALS